LLILLCLIVFTLIPLLVTNCILLKNLSTQCSA
jgi:hypothetical protein